MRRIWVVLVGVALLSAACGSSTASTAIALAPSEPAATSEVTPPSSGPAASAATSAASPTAASAATAASSSPATPAPPSSAATTPAPSAMFDSCSVVTQAQAGAALGQAVRAPVRGKATVEGGIACVFYGPSVRAGADPDIPVTDSVRVVLVTGSDASKFFNDYKSRVPAQAIAGLGDQAYYDGSASLSVLKGDEYLRVAVIGVRDVLGAEKTLVKAVLPKL